MSEAEPELAYLPVAYREHVERVLIPAADISTRLDELAAEVSEDYAGTELLLVGVLKGAIFVVADLHRRLAVPAAVDFMAVSSYGSATTSSGVVRILKDLDTEIEGRHVLVVEDIVDSGLTLDYLLKNLRSRRPATVEVLSLLTKPSRREVDLPIRYVGFEVPDVFVVGYGLDFAEHYRGLSDIVTLKPEAYGA
ncbi:MAG: hypoxanthine phosphoribosyltransferase [Nitriliruptoraceae bacterium]